MSEKKENISEVEDKKLTEEELDNVSGGAVLIPKVSASKSDKATTQPYTKAIGKLS